MRGSGPFQALELEALVGQLGGDLITQPARCGLMRTEAQARGEFWEEWSTHGWLFSRPVRERYQQGVCGVRRGGSTGGPMKEKKSTVKIEMEWPDG